MPDKKKSKKGKTGMIAFEVLNVIITYYISINTHIILEIGKCAKLRSKKIHRKTAGFNLKRVFWNVCLI